MQYSIGLFGRGHGINQFSNQNKEWTVYTLHQLLELDSLLT